MGRGRMDDTTIATLAVMFLVLLFCWNYSFIYPIKVFVVLLHELGHGLAAELTGGDMVRIELSSNLGGVCWSRGGIRWLVLPAGYLGSMLFGGIILVAAAKSRRDKDISTVIGLLVVGLTLYAVRNLFGIVFGLLFGGAMIAAGHVLPEKLNDLLLKFIGLASCCYAIIDIKEDLISRTVPGSDAYKMAEIFPLPPTVWGVIWILIAIYVTYQLLTIAAEGEKG